MAITAKITEQGNGFPKAGDLVADGDGHLYRITDDNSGLIHTAGTGAGNYCYVDVEEADWDELEGGCDPFCCGVSVER